MDKNATHSAKTPSGWKFFTMEEFLRSETADRLGLINVPTQEHVDNMDRLVIRLLDRLREDWGHPIRISSGYRVPRLNEAVGGSRTSQHMYGKAADIQPIDRPFDEFAKFVRGWIGNRDFDQLIFESSKTSRWIHISYDRDRNRRQVFNICK